MGLTHTLGVNFITGILTASSDRHPITTVLSNAVQCTLPSTPHVVLTETFHITSSTYNCQHDTFMQHLVHALCNEFGV